jgi:hypothetical protein
MTAATDHGPLRVTAVATVGPWGTQAAQLLAHAAGTATTRGDAPPPVAGFVGSSFNPLVYSCVKALAAGGGIPRPARTAIVLASGLGDAWTLDAASQCVVRGERTSATLFYQSVPVSILGYAARELGIQGGLLSVSGWPDPWHEALELCRCLLQAGEARAVILLVAATPGSERAQAICRRSEPERCDAKLPDVAFAVSLALPDPTDSTSAWLVAGPGSLVVRRELARADGENAQPWETSVALPSEARTIAGVCMAVERLRAGCAPSAWQIQVSRNDAAAKRTARAAANEVATLVQKRE